VQQAMCAAATIACMSFCRGQLFFSPKEFVRLTVVETFSD
jgi:hypothetical protein